MQNSLLLNCFSKKKINGMSVTGTNLFLSLIEDEDFSKKVQSGRIRFSSKDVLNIILRMEQHVTTECLKTEYFLEKYIKKTDYLEIQPDLFKN